MNEQNGQGSNHYIIPRSRFQKRSGNDRVICIPESFHQAWHIIFHDLYGREIILFIEELNLLMASQDIITSLDLKQARRDVKKLGIYEYKP